MAETSRLNPSEILKNYQDYKTAQDVALSKYTGAQQSTTSFSGELQQQLGKREVSPEIKARERETVSSLFSVPSEVRGELSQAGVRPSEVSGIIGSRMNSYLDQLQSLQENRKSRQKSIEDMVKSVQEGMKSQSTMAELDYKVAKDKTDKSWDEYRESVRQAEHAQTTKLLDNIKNNETLGKNVIFNDFMNLKKKTEESSKEYFGEDYLNKWDGRLDPKEYMTLVNKAETLMPGSGKDWFLKTYNIFDNINLESDYNIKALESSGISLTDEIMKQNEDIRKRMLTMNLEAGLASKDPEIFQNTVETFYSDLIGEGQSIDTNKLLFESYLIRTFGEVQGIELLDKLLP